MADRVVILGAGESGTGAALLAKAKGYQVFVSDQGRIKDKYRRELVKEEIPFEEGVHTLDKLQRANLIVKSPGISEKAEVIKNIKNQRVPVIDEIEFAFKFLKGKVIAVTGTNGKTTTTLLTFHLLKEAGFNVALAGNVGESLARKVAAEHHDWYVLEVSSFQLDGTLSFKPFAGILLNITPDHLDRYEYKMENYVSSKFRLTRNMDSGDYFIYYADDPVVSAELPRRTVVSRKIAVSLTDRQRPVHFDGAKMVFRLESDTFSIAQSDTTLKGPHNLINTMSAVSAAFVAGVNVSAIKKGLKTFKNAPHRLESVAVIGGVEYVNDSKATNVDSVVYALGSYTQPLIWIAGGIDKGNDYSIIKEEVRRKVRALICLGKDNKKLKAFFGEVVNEIHETQTVRELVELAQKAARKGDVVLLSPACASFDLFQNYEDRGNQFREAVLALKQELEKSAN